MTGLLRDALEDRAREAGTPNLDIEGIIRDGDRKVRLRRLSAAAGAAAVVTGIAGAAVLVERGSNDAPEVAMMTGPARGLSYASDNRIYIADEVVEASDAVQSYVLTDTAPVWTVPSGDVVTVQDGESVVLGRTSKDGYYLKADDTGSLVAWIEFPSDAPAELVVYDTASREEMLRTSEGTAPGMRAFRDDSNVAYVFAVDDGSVYWHNLDGAVRTVVATGTTAVFGDPGPFGIEDVASGQLVYDLGETGPDGSGVGLRVGPSLDDGVALGHQGDAYLSPDATYVAIEDADEMVVANVATGAEVTPKVRGYAYRTVTQWLDDDTAVVMGLKSAEEDEPLQVEFLTCEISTGACAVERSDTVTYGSFQLPVGERIGD